MRVMCVRGAHESLLLQLPPGGAGGSSMAAGRSGPGQAGKAGNGKKRGNSAASAGPGGMVGNMSPGMIGNYGGGPDDGAGGVYAEDLPAQGEGAIQCTRTLDRVCMRAADWIASCCECMRARAEKRPGVKHLV